ncbi:hypothetical protein CSHISOI_03488 [Colletotrichum shisoi]|uniref:BTB domain-containing protein n=1 Tax=Colletotrichum shisoi TaxID=2078593 RepID=A0A5Q4C0G7_9PEZI|nr:hypothetical protein CSHISOI_03488 [Colletotrichum shisoi]
MSLKRKIDMDEILTSRSVEFIVGPKGTMYTVHSSSLTALSQPLKEIVGLSRRRKGDETVDWTHVEQSTFINLMEYAYSRDYTIADPSKKKTWGKNSAEFRESGSFLFSFDSDDGESLSDDEAFVPAQPITTADAEDKPETITNEAEKADSLYSWILEVSKSPNSRQHWSAQYRFCLENFTIDTTVKAPTDAWLKSNQLQHDSGYQTVLKTHLNLYFLADVHEITERKELCLDRIRLTLLHAPKTDEVASSLLDAIDVVYANTDIGNPLRSLLVKYCATDMEWMMGGGGVAKITPVIRDVPSFAADLLLEIPHAYWKEVGDGGGAPL